MLVDDRIKGKKGQQAGNILNQAPILVVGILVLAVVLAIGIQVLDEIQDIQDTNDEGGSVVNESLVVATNTFQQLNNARISSATVTVTNATGVALAFVMLAPQADLGQINITDSLNDGNDANVSYSFTVTIQSSSFNATGDGILGLATFSGFQVTIAVIVVAVVVISLLLGGFAFARGRQ